jgi:SAM-dependent methyltransferase
VPPDFTDPLYADPDAYDVAYGWDSSAETAALVGHAAQRRGRPIRRALEIGCGPGRVLRELAALGLDAIGLDREPALLECAARRARECGLTVTTQLGDMRDFVLDAPVDFAICPLNGVCDLTGDGDLVRHFTAVAANLSPGGIYAIEMSFGPVEKQFLGAPAPWRRSQGDLSVEADWRLLDVDAETGLAGYEASLHIARAGAAPRRIVCRHVHRKWDQPQFYRAIADSPLVLAAMYAGDLTPLDPARRLTYADDNVFVFLQR